MTEITNTQPSAEQALHKTFAFLKEIGIPVRMGPIPAKTLLPGLCIYNGELLVDMNELKYPGDILHEAGHIAVVPAAERNSLNEESIALRERREAEEMMAIAWSYAACVHLGIDPSFVFHDKGYKGGGTSIAKNFKAGHYVGVPMLQWIGMTLDPKEPGGYPEMLMWVMT